ncbi:MAG: hypothetical protein AAB877_03250 [Patescibacteria group bacterium]
MKKISKNIILFFAVAFFSIGLFALVANATHSWGSYHWARTSNPFTLKLGDNVSTDWDAYLAQASSDWSLSSVLDTKVVAGGIDPRRCKGTNGRVDVCSSKYGFNGWLGLAQIWVSGSHITKGVAKMNDSYFNTSTYNTPAWRRLVMCQEIAHTFGLDHQDENFYNLNLGSCMDYTNDPDGPPSNEHPNNHDYEQLELIYAHLDSTTTILAQEPSGARKGNGNNGNNAEMNLEDPSEWGKSLRKDSQGKDSLFERDLGRGEKVFTFVIWKD